MGLFKEFKDFINRGNVVDLAVGVVIGAAFSRIVTSLVNDILMPPLGLVLNGVNFSEIKYVLKGAGVDATGKATPPVTINIGLFIQVLIEFLIVAFVIFLVVKFINNMKKKSEAIPPPAAPTREQELLTEIRDLLRK